MPKDRPYSIATTGVVLAGFDLEQTVSGFAALFGVAPEKAAAYLDRRQLIRKDLSEEEAEDYRARLNAIGVAVELYGRPIARARDPRPSTDTPDPITGAEAGEVVSGTSAATILDTPTGKAQLVLGKDASGTARAFILPILVAIILAVIWRFVTLALGAEPGFFGSFIGAAIGLVAAAAGSRGTRAGTACALLTVLTIVAGKGLVMSSDQSHVFGLLAGDADTNAVRERMDEYASDARAFGTIDRDDDSMKAFMVEHAYSEALASRLVSQAELDAFRESTQPWLENYRVGTDLPERVDESSIVVSLARSFNTIDIGFLMLGAATAFLLGSGSMNRS